MSLYGVVANRGDLHPAQPNDTLVDGLRIQLAALPQNVPVTILVHGFKWAPDAAALGAPLKNPFLQIFSLTPRSSCHKVTSWPAGLGFDARPASGLCIPLGWSALSTATLGRVPASGFREIYDRAQEAGSALCRLVQLIRLLAPGRTVDVLAHSLGARVALEAIAQGACFGRVILLSGAETAAVAENALNSNHGADVFNITTRTNTFYEALFALSVPCEGRTLAQMTPTRNTINIMLDRWDVRDALARIGYPIAQPRRRMCHWSTYTAQGALAFYGALLRHKTLTAARLSEHISMITRVHNFA